MWSMTNGHGMRSSRSAYDGEVLGVEVQHDVPPERHDPVDDPPEHVELGCAAEMGDEVETCAADTDVVEPTDVGVGERFVDHRHAGVPAGAAFDRVDHRRVVRAVAARLDEHGTRQTEPFLQCFEVVDARVGRGVGPVGGEREAVAGAEDVAVGVARVRWGDERRRRGAGRGGAREWWWRSSSTPAGTRCRPSACARCGRCPARSTIGVPSSSRSSTAAANVPVGCSSTTASSACRSRSSFAGAVWQERGRGDRHGGEHADGVVTLVRDEHPRAQVAAVARRRHHRQLRHRGVGHVTEVHQDPGLQSDLLEPLAQRCVGVQLVARSRIR